MRKTSVESQHDGAGNLRFLFFFFSFLRLSHSITTTTRCSKRSKVGASQDGCDVITCKAYSLWVRELVCRTTLRESEAHNVKMVKIYDFLWKSLRPNIMGNAWTLCVAVCCYVLWVSLRSNKAKSLPLLSTPTKLTIPKHDQPTDATSELNSHRKPSIKHEISYKINEKKYIN